MRERIQKQKTNSVSKTEPIQEYKPVKTDDELKAETDALLDEIDELLEVNAEDFVREYIQKGGE